MIKNISIKNFALIDFVEVEFSKGLNLLTGETGAGKSIIVDALMILLGDRASSDFIREGEQKAIIEAVFELKKSNPIYQIFSDNEIDSDNSEFIIRRELSIKGTSRCFINDSPVQVSLLKKIGDLLVDFHGQHDHQLLLNSDNHLKVFDSTSKNQELVNHYRNLYDKLKSDIALLEKTIRKNKDFADNYEKYEFELNEILKINPKPDEEQLLEDDLNILENSETLFQLSNEVIGIYDEGDYSIRDRLIFSEKKLEQLNKIDSRFEPYFNECNSVIISISEISKFLKSYLSSIQFDPIRIEEIRERLQQLNGLRKKYGTYESIFERINELKSQLSFIENFNDEIKSLKENIIIQKKEIAIIAEKISNARHKFAKEFDNSIIESLKNLGIENGNFKVNFSYKTTHSDNYHTSNTIILKNNEYELFKDGIDLVEFYVSTNKGETPKQLSQIASGGEISRIMLSIKSIVAESDELPMLVFDEIDNGISGRIAQKVGTTMKNLAKNHQLIAITHLPQIAAMSDKHILVEKKVVNNRTIINIKTLSAEEKIREVARLLSGEIISDASIESAKELIMNK